MSMPSTVAPTPKRSRPRSILKRVINTRRGVQVALGIATWLVVTRYGISLWWVVLVAIVSGVLLGKYFCRWACPMGAIMEMMLGAGGEDNKQKSLYSYFKIGCPIAWAGGLLNKISVLRVKVDESKCSHCSACDKACYVAQLSDGRSLHQGGKVNASTHYSCSRCLSCVKVCPSNALTLGPAWPFGTLLPATGLVRPSEPSDAGDALRMEAIASPAPAPVEAALSRPVGRKRSRGRRR